MTPTYVACGSGEDCCQRTGESETGAITSEASTMRVPGIAILNFHGLIAASAPRVRWHQVVRTVVDHKLAIVLAAVLDGECPDAGVVRQPVAKKS
jgi:hypothetical protein